jgi:hypothetical protein
MVLVMDLELNSTQMQDTLTGATFAATTAAQQVLSTQGHGGVSCTTTHLCCKGFVGVGDGCGVEKHFHHFLRELTHAGVWYIALEGVWITPEVNQLPAGRHKLEVGDVSDYDAAASLCVQVDMQI